MKFYLHQKQEDFLFDVHKKIITVLGQRAGGKSGALYYRCYQLAIEMPKSRCFLGAGTIDQLKNVTVPQMFAVLDKYLGLEEGVDYVLFKKPPPHFTKPLKPLTKFDRFISWSNGSITELISPKILQIIRGTDFDGGCIDEALLWSWKMISQVLLPTFRGNLHRFKKCPLHFSLSIFSSLPRTVEAMWLLSMQKKAEADPLYYAYYFFTWLDNVFFNGADYGERMRKTMDGLEYQIEVEGKINIKTGVEYYHQFNYPRLTYVVNSNGYIGKSRIKEYNPFAPLDLSFDFASHFNCAWIIQPNDLEFRVIDTCHVYFEDKINVLIKNIASKYQSHQNKHINIFGEPFGMKQREDNSPLFIQVQQLFIQLGWSCTIWVDSYDKADTHKKRFIEMNEVFEESHERPHLPFFRFNAETCEDAIIAIQKTKVRPEDYKKDKNVEKHPREYNQAHAPHYGDALDNYYRQKTNTSRRRSGGGNAGVR
jgi:hypothetical protein